VERVDAGVGGEGDITADFMEDTGAVLLVDITVDFMEDIGEAILADIIGVTKVDPMEDPVIMAELWSASAGHTISPLGAGTTLDTTRNTTTAILRQFMINPLQLMRHFLLDMLSLHPIPKISVLAIPYLRLQLVRSHQILVKEDAQTGPQSGSFTANRDGPQKRK
jgi:hypothetical protein